MANVGWQCSQQRGTNQDKPLKCNMVFRFDWSKTSEETLRATLDIMLPSPHLGLLSQVASDLFLKIVSPGTRNINLESLRTPNTNWSWPRLIFEPLNGTFHLDPCSSLQWILQLIFYSSFLTWWHQRKFNGVANFALWRQWCLIASRRQRGLTAPSAVCKLISGAPGWHRTQRWCHHHMHLLLSPVACYLGPSGFPCNWHSSYHVTGPDTCPPCTHPLTLVFRTS